MTRPTRYTENSSSRDWIDEFCATSSAEEVRGAFRFTIGKYLRRYGKKDDPLQEAIKIQDYANRLVEFELAQLATVKQSLTVEPASLIDDESPRMQAIGQNGNDGLHYHAMPIEVVARNITDAQMLSLSKSMLDREIIEFVVTHVDCGVDKRNSARLHQIIRVPVSP